MNYFSYSLLVIASLSNKIHSQNADYYILTRKADSLYKVADYIGSARTYSKAFQLLKGKGLIEDRYNAARSFALAKQADSATYNLERILPFINNYDILEDQSFKLLYNSEIWNKIKVKKEHEESIIQKNAILYNESQVPNDQLSLALKNYKCISIGELHGTKESSDFLKSTINVFNNNEQHIIVGFEIDNSAMTKYIEDKTTGSLAETAFFKFNFGDGKNSDAWYNAIKYCNELNIKTFFFNDSPDSAMAQNIIACYEADTNAIFITLGGNVHNMLEPYKNNQTMGCYLKKYFGYHYLAVGHLHGDGTMYNLTSKGLKISEVPSVTGVYKTALKNKQNYFIMNIFENSSQRYNAFFYTDTISASFPLYYKK